MRKIRIIDNNPQDKYCSDISKYIGQEFNVYEENIHVNYIEMPEPNHPDYVITIWNEEFEYVD
jgi:hypothetical protein